MDLQLLKTIIIGCFLAITFDRILGLIVKVIMDLLYERRK